MCEREYLLSGRVAILRTALRMFVNGPPSRGMRVDGWAAPEDEYRICGYCLAKSPHGNTPLAHYNTCAFSVGRAALREVEHGPA